MAKVRHAAGGLVQRRPRLKGWPSSVPCFFLPLDEGKGEFVTNHGTMGDPVYRLTDPATQWRSDGRFTTNDSKYEIAWPPTKPENATFLDKLYFFRDCIPANPGVGGNILMVSFRAEGPVGMNSRTFSVGVSGNSVDAAAWQIHIQGLANVKPWLRFFYRDGVTEVGSDSLADLNATLEGGIYVRQENHVVMLLDALNADVFVWLDGVPVAIAQANKDSAIALFKQFTSPTDWDTNGVTLTVGNSCFPASAPGYRESVGTGKSLYGSPLSDLFIADVTALDAVLAARRDDIANAMYKSPVGMLSEDVIALMTL